MNSWQDASQLCMSALPVAMQRHPKSQASWSQKGSYGGKDPRRPQRAEPFLETPSLTAQALWPLRESQQTPSQKSRLQGAGCHCRALKVTSTMRSGSRGGLKHTGNTVAIFKNHSIQSSFPNHGVSPLYYLCTNPGFWNHGHRQGGPASMNSWFWKAFWKEVYLRKLLADVHEMTFFIKRPFPQNFVGSLSGQNTLDWTLQMSIQSHDIKISCYLFGCAESIGSLLKCILNICKHILLTLTFQLCPREDVSIWRPNTERLPREMSKAYKWRSFQQLAYSAHTERALFTIPYAQVTTL